MSERSLSASLHARFRGLDWVSLVSSLCLAQLFCSLNLTKIPLEELLSFSSLFGEEGEKRLRQTVQEAKKTELLGALPNGPNPLHEGMFGEFIKEPILK